MYDIVIIGGGPAGLTAAVYGRRAGKSVLIIEKSAFGGQITWSPKVENFPGMVSVSGTELGDRLLEQAMEQGAEVELDEITAVKKLPGSGIFILSAASDTEYEARAVIFAGGAKPRLTGLPGENELIGNGVCFCAVCDGAFYAGMDVAVYGGGNSALQDALLLSETCRKVYLIHRRAAFRGEAKLVEALQERSNVEFILNASITELLGSSELNGIKVAQSAGEHTVMETGRQAAECQVTGRESTTEQNAAFEKVISVDGLFVAIGHAPDNGIIAPLAELDAAGCAVSGEGCTTATPGLFVAGDCRTKSVRQVTTACADGAVAALAACSYLDKGCF